MHKPLSRRFIGIIIGLLLFDFVSKMIALHTLSFTEGWDLIPGILGLKLTINPLELEHVIVGNRHPLLLENYERWAWFLGSLVLILLVAYISWVRSQNWLILYKYLVGLGLGIVLFSISSILSTLLPGSPPALGLIGLITFTKIILPIYLLFFFKDNQLRWAFTFLVAGNLGNFASFFYPPYRVIDFFISWPFNKIFGVGIFNLADIYGYLFVLLMILYVLKWGIYYGYKTDWLERE